MVVLIKNSNFFLKYLQFIHFLTHGMSEDLVERLENKFNKCSGVEFFGWLFGEFPGFGVIIMISPSNFIK